LPGEPVCKISEKSVLVRLRNLLHAEKCSHSPRSHVSTYPNHLKLFSRQLTVAIITSHIAVVNKNVRETASIFPMDFLIYIGELCFNDRLRLYLLPKSVTLTLCLRKPIKQANKILCASLSIWKAKIGISQVTWFVFLLDTNKEIGFVSH